MTSIFENRYAVALKRSQFRHFERWIPFRTTLLAMISNRLHGDQQVEA